MNDAADAGRDRAGAYAALLERPCACGAELHNEIHEFTVGGSPVVGWRSVCDACGYVSDLFEPLVRFRRRHPVEVADLARSRNGLSALGPPGEA